MAENKIGRAWQSILSALMLIIVVAILILMILLILSAFFEIADITGIDNKPVFQQAFHNYIDSNATFHSYSENFGTDNFRIFRIIAVLLIGFFLLIFLKEERGVSILPFELGKEYESLYEKKAISDMLRSELQNTKRIHDVIDNFFLGEKLEDPDFKAEDLDYNFSNLGTIEIGGASIPLGQVSILLRKFIPGRGYTGVINGSIQKIGLYPAIQCILSNHKNICWIVSTDDIEDEAINKLNDSEAIPELIKVLSTRIAYDLTPSTEAKTLKGFEYFTKALDIYYRHIVLGSNNKDLNLLNDSAQLCYKALEAERDYRKPLFLLFKIGSRYLEFGNLDNIYLDKAEEVLKKANEYHPNDISASVWMGFAYEIKGDGDKAAKYYEKVSNINLPIGGIQRSQYPSQYYCSDYNNMGYAFAALGRYKDAEACYKKAIERCKNYAFPYRNEGNALVLMGKPEHAIKEFDQAIKKFVNAKNYTMASRVLVDKGRALFLIKDMPRYRMPIYLIWNTSHDELYQQTFEEALRYYPNNIQARIAVAACHKLKSRDNVAKFHCESISESVKKETEIIRARYYFVYDDNKTAIDNLNEAIKKKQCTKNILNDIEFKSLNENVRKKILDLFNRRN